MKLTKLYEKLGSNLYANYMEFLSLFVSFSVLFSLLPCT